MSKPIIRTEVQVTPTFDMFGREQYAWRIYQVTDGVNINLESGFEGSFTNANYESYKRAINYIE